MDKSEVITALLDGINERFTDAVQSAEREMFQHGGAAKQLLVAARNITGLVELIDEDVKKGRFPADDLHLLQRVKNYVARAATMCMEQSKAESRRAVVAEGRLQGAQTLLKITTQRVADEQRKQEQKEEFVQQETVGSDPRRRPAGVHPGRSLKQQRLAEEAALKKQENFAKKAAADASAMMKSEAPPKKTKRKTKAAKKAPTKRKEGGTNS